MSQWEDTVRSDVRKKLDDTTAAACAETGLPVLRTLRAHQDRDADYPRWLWKNDRGRHVEITASVHDFRDAELITSIRSEIC